jgi:hypothetical protein
MHNCIIKHYQLLHVLIHIISQVKVEFLDYGGSESVGVSLLRLLPEKFTDIPFQGISSSLCSKSPTSSLVG